MSEFPAFCPGFIHCFGKRIVSDASLLIYYIHTFIDSSMYKWIVNRLIHIFLLEIRTGHESFLLYTYHHVNCLTFFHFLEIFVNLCLNMYTINVERYTLSRHSNRKWVVQSLELWVCVQI